MSWLEYTFAFGPWALVAILIAKDLSDDMCGVSDRTRRPWLYHDQPHHRKDEPNV